MKFRFVLLNPDDDSNQAASPPECDGGLLSRHSRIFCYERKGAGMVRVERPQKGSAIVTAVANFHARIVGDLCVDGGDRERREFRVEAEVAGRTIFFSVSAVEFSRMDWALKKLGPQAIIYPGQQQHARAAIQWLSDRIRQQRIYIRRVDQILFRSEVSLGRLNGRVTEQHLNLLQLSARGAAQLRACPPVMPRAA